MGHTRPKKTKKASKEAGDISKPIKQSLEKLTLNDDAVTPPQTAASAPSAQKSSGPTPTTAPATPLHADPSYITIQSTPTKGLAVFAARKIPAGTLILSETPLIRLTQADEDQDKADPNHTSTLLTQHIQSLPKPAQKSYLSLFDSQKSSFPLLKSIYYSNCYNLTNRTSGPGGSCIGVIASRINHSCVPNVQFSYDEEAGLMLFHATKPIARGRELVSNYDGVYEGRVARRRRQLMYYGFECDCEACEPGSSEFWGRSDERRKAMAELMRRVKRAEEEEEGGDARVDLVRLEGLLVKEGLLGLVLADVYRCMVRWCEKLGDTEGVRKWRGKELDVCVTCLGEGAMRVRELRKNIEETG